MPSASPEERKTTLAMVTRVAESIFIPFTVGGGIRAVADAGAALRAGADKVSVNTAAVRDPTLVSRLAESFGTQCVVAAVDVKRIDGRLTVMALSHALGSVGERVLLLAGEEVIQL